MLPDIEFEGRILCTADDAAAAMKQLLGKKDTGALVELMEWMAGNDTLRPAFRDPEIVLALAEAAKAEILQPPGVWTGPHNGITRLMHGQPGFLDNLRGDEDFSRTIGERAWQILQGNFKRTGTGFAWQQILNYRNLESVASPVVDFKSIIAGAVPPEAIKTFTGFVLQMLDWPARIERDSDDVIPFNNREFVSRHDREECYRHFRDYIALTSENPVLKPALEDASIAAALEIKLREIVANQPEFSSDLVMMKGIVARVPHLAAIFEKIEGVDEVFKNILSLNISGDDECRNVVLARDAEGKTTIPGGVHEKLDIGGAFRDALRHGQFTGRSHPDIARAEKIIELTEMARERGWTVEGDIAGLVERIDAMGEPYHDRLQALVPTPWRGIAARVAAQKAEAKVEAERPVAVAATGTGGWRGFLSRWGANR